MEFDQILLIAAFVEALVQTIKPVYDKEKGWNVDILVALAIAEVVCVGFGVDLFDAAGIKAVVPYLGSVLTGILLSRGANVVHEIIQIVRTFGKSLATK
jgi:hypothetical protein